jgi:SAM-dependent methyltransferase
MQVTASTLAPEIEAILRCPRCFQPVLRQAQTYYCANPSCAYASESFLTILGQPVLIDFEQSIFSRDSYATAQGLVMPREFKATGRSRVRHWIHGTNPITPIKAPEFLKRLASRSARPRLLIIGGGVLGQGTEALYQSEAIERVGIDVYASPFTALVADAHQLPFQDASFDGVWIQAVLEHVLEPQQAVAEIHRVLRPEGLFYAETPFMQQVHEGAYDFTRFTQSGHRWLFRRFQQIDAGVVAGAGTAAFWSVKYLVQALGLQWARLALPFFWLRLLDRFTQPRANADAACCLYFLGTKSEKALTPKEMVAYY